MDSPVHILGLSGSARRLSFNTGLLHAAAELLPAATTLTIAEYTDLPFFNEDLEQAEGFPASVQRLRDQIAAADALLIATPEYNHSVPALLKNAIDWVSRPGPAGEQPFAGRPLAMMGASPSLFGTARAQLHLRQIASALDLLTLNKPELLVMRASQKFSDGRLTDAPTRARVGELVVALVAWTRRLRGAGLPSREQSDG